MKSEETIRKHLEDIDNLAQSYWARINRDDFPLKTDGVKEALLSALQLALYGRSLLKLVLEDENDR